MIRDRRRVGAGQGRAEGKLAQICAALTRSLQRGGANLDGRAALGLQLAQETVDGK